MKKVLIPQAIHEEGMRLLQQEVEVVMGSGIAEEVLLSEAADCDAILTRTAKITAKIMENSPKLKVVAKHGIGLDNIDVKKATEKGIAVVNAPEANIDSVAEHALGMILALAKNFLIMDGKVRQGLFEARNEIIGTEIKGKTLGMVGFGRIAAKLAKKIKALDIDVIAYDPYLDASIAKELGVKTVEKADEIYENSDIISVHVPLTDSTRGMIDRMAFKKMKNNAYFINVARGPVVVEDALYNALKDGEIKAAAIDVFEKEPPKSDNPLFQLDNILFSPHNAALTEEALIAMGTHAAQGILDFLNGKKPKYMVNPEIYK